MGAYAPCIQMGKVIMQYENQVTALTSALATATNAVVTKYNASAIAGTSGPLSANTVKSYAAYLTSASTTAVAEIGTKIQTGQCACRVTCYHFRHDGMCGSAFLTFATCCKIVLSFFSALFDAHTTHANHTALTNRFSSASPLTADPTVVLNSLYKVLSVIQNNTIMTLGQPSIYPSAHQCFNGTANLTSCISPMLVQAANLKQLA